MRWTLVRYRTYPDKADENARLIAAVFAELKYKAPSGLHYAAVRVADDTFVHVVSRADGAMRPTDLDAFRHFQSGFPQRCAEQPLVLEAAVVGNYQMLTLGSDTDR